MADHIFRLRRGTRYVDDNGVTLLKPDGTPVRDDWRTYETLNGHVKPLEGEVVLEYEVNPNTGKKTPRLKIGDGINEFGALPYMSVDSFILPTPASVTIYADKWVEAADDNRYYQIVTVDNATITSNSKVDLQPSSEQLSIFHDKDLAFVTENENGIVSVYCVGQVPTSNYIIQCTVTEVVTNE